VTDQWWLHWITDRDALLSVYQGTVGALIGFLGLFSVYKATQRSEKKKHQKEQTLAGVATLVEKAYKVASITPENMQPALDFSHELTLFALRGLPKRKDTAQWAMFYSNYCTSRTDFPDDKVILEFARIAGTVAADLITWVNLKNREGFLTEQRAKQDLKKIRANLHVEAPPVYELLLED
jgi:hypothetical protein